MVNTHHEKALKASSSKGVEPPTNDVDNERNKNESSSDSEDLDLGVVVKKRTKLTSPQISSVIVLRYGWKEKFMKMYHRNEKLKVEKFQRMICDDIREVISPFKCTTLDDLLSRARVREADLLRKNNKETKETKRKLDFVDRDA
nr:zinc finger, CCHC-type, retrotransposon Gag domain protein [Tanacetum cinerariifolium]